MQNTQETSYDDNLTATYSPEDNKLRLYSFYRLDDETYQRVKDAGFKWAPKQDLFFAPMWTPARADLLIELCGFIDDEQTSLEDRAAVRADRFEGYQEKRAKDAENAFKAVQAITDHIPFGQPILVGHHSEKRARKDAKRIERGMSKAVQMWETSEYWEYRVKGVIRHANYKDRADVRARRIKSLEADLRKYQRNIAEAEKIIKMWTNPDHELTKERAQAITNYYDHYSRRFPLSEFPRSSECSQYEGYMDLYSAIEFLTPEQARDLSMPSKHRTIAHYTRWVEHTQLRLAYECAILEQQGGADLLKPKPRPKQPPICNYRAPEGIRIENMYHAGEFAIYPQVEMTKAEYSAINKDYKATRPVEGTHKVRVAMVGFNGSLACVFLTDSKVHTKPGGAA